MSRFEITYGNKQISVDTENYYDLNHITKEGAKGTNSALVLVSVVTVATMLITGVNTALGYTLSSFTDDTSAPKIILNSALVTVAEALYAIAEKPFYEYCSKDSNFSFYESVSENINSYTSSLPPIYDSFRLAYDIFTDGIFE